MVVLESEGYGDRRKPIDAPVPPELIAEIKAWKESSAKQGGDLSTINPVATLIAKSPLADERHEQHCNDVHERHGGDDAASASVWARAPEKSAKLALIHAMCTNWREPEITVAAVNWGRTLTNYTTRMVISQATTRVGKRQYEKDKEWLWARIESGMTMSQLARKTQGMKRRDRNEMVAEFIESGVLEMERTETKTKPITRYKKTRKMF
jgi:hypothetical protein